MILDVEKELNKLALIKLKLLSDFISINKQLENNLDEFRINLAKARLCFGEFFFLEHRFPYFVAYILFLVELVNFVF